MESCSNDAEQVLYLEINQNLALEMLIKMMGSIESRHPHRRPLWSRTQRLQQQEGTSHEGQSLPHCTTGLTGGSAHLGLLQCCVLECHFFLFLLLHSHIWNLPDAQLASSHAALAALLSSETLIFFGDQTLHTNKLGTVAHTCNPSTFGSQGRQIMRLCSKESCKLELLAGVDKNIKPKSLLPLAKGSGKGKTSCKDVSDPQVDRVGAALVSVERTNKLSSFRARWAPKPFTCTFHAILHSVHLSTSSSVEGE
ncbi:hypothetical protein AAY473_005622 [Plecturocebus cupreus]